MKTEELLAQEYKEQLLECAKNGDKSAITELARFDHVHFSQHCLDELMNIELNTIKDALVDVMTPKIRVRMIMHEAKRKHMLVDQNTTPTSRSDKYLAEVDFLKSQRWWRGLNAKLDDIDNPVTNMRDSNYPVFITNDPIQAASYAGLDGCIAELELNNNFELIHHKTNSENRFSMFTFDSEAKRASENEGVVAQDVYDNGMFLDAIHQKIGMETIRKIANDAINIALNPATRSLNVVSIKQTESVLNEHVRDSLLRLENCEKLPSSLPSFHNQSPQRPKI
ncbi:hypothetical protein [Photobacterium damselae]|uniref:hypothetical protein n=1 Tax=Photobacterium damselae TaxID=38293 RepID=UPI0040688956